MARQYYGGPITPIPSAVATPYASSLSIADVSAAPQPVIGANQLEVGSIIQVIASGVFSNTGTPTLILGVYYGAVAGVALAATVAVTTITGAANWPWRIEYEGVVASVGSGGTINGSGQVYMPASISQFQAPYAIPGAAQAAVTIDTTSSKTLTIGATWSASSASNTLTLRHYTAQILN